MSLYRLFTYKGFIGKIIRLPLKFIPSKLVVRVIGGPLRGYKWIFGSSNRSCIVGRYETKLVYNLINYLKKGDIFYDLGAHVGYMTLIGSLVIGKSGLVYAFEPDSRNYNLLKKHIYINNINNVIAFKLAVSNTNEEKYFFQSNVSLASKITEAGNAKVRVINMLSFIKENNLKKPNVIKMDIEGEEYKVLISLRSLLLKDKPIIFLSVHGKNLKEKCLDFLNSIGYKHYPLDKPLSHNATEFMVKAN